MPAIDVEILLLRENALPPRYMTEHAAGMDLYACLGASLTLPPGERTLVPTGVAMAIPEGFEGQVRARSGLALRHGLALVNAPGTIDADYRGEISVLLINLGQEEVGIGHAERIAQLVVAPVMHARLHVVEALSDTQRSAGGFGHTGVAHEEA